MPKPLTAQDRLRLRMDGALFDDGTKVDNEEEEVAEQSDVAKAIGELVQHTATMTKSVVDFQRTVATAIANMAAAIEQQSASIDAIVDSLRQQNKQTVKTALRSYVFDVRRENGSIKQIIATERGTK